MGLLQPYTSPNLEQVMQQFRDPAKLKGNYSSAVYVGILGFGVNTQRLKEKNLPVPQCWKDLTKPEYKGEIQIADPQTPAPPTLRWRPLPSCGETTRPSITSSS